MCGIAGFTGKGDEASLWQMVRSIAHRGPDFQDVSFHENVGLAHARLSIMDLDSRSHQPFFTPDRAVAVTFNGEIYNYVAIKEALLETQKYTFRTTSDTEVLLYAYCEYGTDFLQKIQGMFGLAIYDYRKKELLLARDRMGKKPIYYTLTNDTFVFASELKAILKHPSVSRELNFDALSEYLTFDYIPTPNSIFKNIYKLEPAHYLIVKESRIVEKAPYWNISFQKSTITFNDAQERLDQLLNEAVCSRMMSDVPLGVFLSGGIDSSAVAYYAQKNSTQKISTFSIGFHEKSYDESNYARMVARHLGTDHHEQILTAKHSLELLPEITEKLDEPFADPSIIPTYFLSKFTRQHVTVSLGGDGSDELMAGYPTFISERLSSLLHLFPKPLIRLLDRISNFMPVSDKNLSLDFKIQQFLKGFEKHRAYTHSLWLGSFIPAMKGKLLTHTSNFLIGKPDSLEIVDTHMQAVKTDPYFDQLIYVYLKTYLLESILVKVDRASMYNSLEVRAPFLDTAVVTFLNSLPKEYKIKGNNGKRILKAIMRNKLPDDVINRPKKGFGIPVSLWIRNELKDRASALLSPGRIKKQGIFNHKYVDQLMTEHQQLKRNHRKLLWNLMIFQIWNETYCI